MLHIHFFSEINEYPRFQHQQVSQLDHLPALGHRSIILPALVFSLTFLKHVATCCQDVPHFILFGDISNLRCLHLIFQKAEARGKNSWPQIESSPGLRLSPFVHTSFNMHLSGVMGKKERQSRAPLSVARREVAIRSKSFNCCGRRSPIKGDHQSGRMASLRDSHDLCTAFTNSSLYGSVWSRSLAWEKVSSIKMYQASMMGW